MRLANDSGKPVTDVARDLGISVQLLYKWQDEVKKYGPSAFPGHRNPRQKDESNEELVRLRKENARLREERDILKKAAAFFAREK